MWTSGNIYIDKTTVEKVESFKFLGIHITDNLKWTTHTASVVKKAQYSLFDLRRLNKIGLSPKIVFFFTDTQFKASCQAVSPPGMEIALPATARLSRGWCGLDQRITGGKLPAPQDTYSPRCHRKTRKIIKDITHSSHCLFTPLPSRRRGQYRCIKAGTKRLKNSFYLKAIRLLNSHHEHIRGCCL